MAPPTDLEASLPTDLPGANAAEPAVDLGRSDLPAAVPAEPREAALVPEEPVDLGRSDLSVAVPAAPREAALVPEEVEGGGDRRVETSGIRLRISAARVPSPASLEERSGLGGAAAPEGAVRPDRKESLTPPAPDRSRNVEGRSTLGVEKVGLDTRGVSYDRDWTRSPNEREMPGWE